MRLFNKKFIAIVIVFVVLLLVSKKSCNVKPTEFSIEKGSIGYTSDITIRYQYSFLNEEEQEIYDLFLAAISNGDRGVNLNYFKISKDTCEKIFEAVLFDNPDLFWLASNYTTLSDDKIVNAIYFKYFDGVILDDFDVETYNEFNYRFIANQDNIKKRIDYFNQKATSVKNELVELSAYEKELYLHDFVAKTITYNKEAADEMDQSSYNSYRRYFDAYNAYGALIKGSVVCEGYAKLFQYLCLLSDINCTRVIGEANGGPHAWNAVWLTDNWYFVDVTFDDIESEEIYCIYDYLNISYETLGLTHDIDTTLMSVPDCSSNKLSYNEKHLINYQDNMITKNYPELIANEIKNGKEYIMVYFPNSDYSYKTFEKLLYNINPSFKDCITQNGKKIKKLLSIDKEYAVIVLK